MTWTKTHPVDDGLYWLNFPSQPDTHPSTINPFPWLLEGGKWWCIGVSEGRTEKTLKLVETGVEFSRRMEPPK